MIDVKKLITGFLILAATAAISAGFILSPLAGVLGQSSASNPPVAQATISDSATSSALANNAFLNTTAIPYDTSSDVLPTYVSATAVASSSADDQNNLTDLFADAYLGGVIGTNPNGPALDANGNPEIAVPDALGIANVVANASATEQLQIPNWDTEANSQAIRVLPTSNTTTIAQYDTAFSNVVSSHLTSQVDTILDNPDTADTSDLASVGTAIQQTLGDTLALQTPASLVGTQRDLVKLLVYDKNSIQLLVLAQTDPVKASLIYQQESDKFQAAEDAFQADINKMSSSTGATSLNADPTSPDAFVAMVDAALGIQTAHAQLEVIDNALTFLTSSIHVQNIGDKVQALIKNILLQILKNTLIAVIQRKVLVWIQGSGAPRFITNWSTQLVNAYTQAAIGAINGAMSCDYAGFTGQLNVLLRLPYTGQSGPSCGNTFAKALGGSTLQQFESSFKSGSWLAFGAGNLPTNNYYSSLFFNSQIVDYNGKNAQVAIQAKSVASQGAKGDQVCADGSNPNGISYYCTSPDGKDYTSNTPCPANNVGTQEVEANNGTCANGDEPNGTTPGIFTVNTENSAGDSSPKLLVGANDIVGVLNAVANSLISGLANAAISAAGNAVNGILSVNPTSIQGGGTPPPGVALSCTPSTQTIQSSPTSTPPITIAATGGTLDVNDNPPTYTWLSSDGATSSLSIFTHTFSGAGTYSVTLNDSTGDAAAICNVTVQ